MTFSDTYKIRYNGRTIWTGAGDSLDAYPGCDLIQTIPVVIADDGYELEHEGENIGQWAVVLHPRDEYSERPYQPDFEEIEKIQEADL